jgi:signal transduction histidine kinase/CheY-like chemotaxis protein
MHWRDRLRSALGISHQEKIELQERMQHVRATTTIIISAVLLFSGFNLATPHMAGLGFSELISLALFFIPAALLGKQASHIELAEALAMLGAVWVCSSLYLFGGIEGTGLYWVYTLPFLFFFLKGQRRGWHYSMGYLAFMVLCATVLAPRLPFAYPFSAMVSTQFLLSLFFYTLVAAAFNHARNRFEAQLQLRHSQAEAASQGKSRFLAAASHDLRQPAHALGLFVARLNQLPHSAQTQDLIQGVDASVRALQEMLDAFFDYSRLDSQLTRAHIQDFAVNSVLDKLRTSFSDTAALTGVRLRIRPSTHWVRSDPVLLHRILLNLISNAVQHTSHGTVLVACRPSHDGTTLRIEVRDNGIGIATEHHQKIFEEFFQIENPERDRDKGLGLGLSIVERSCGLLNHPITLHSRLGQGACFSIRVTAAQAPQEPMHVLQIPQDLEITFENTHILLIEDDALGSVALKGLLESWGCKVTLADSALGARSQWNPRDPVNFVLSDYRLRGTHSGVDAVHLVRDAARCQLPACIISGDTGAEVKALIQSAGLVLLQKPIKPAQLRSVIRHALSAHRSGAA